MKEDFQRNLRLLAWTNVLPWIRISIKRVSDFTHVKRFVLALHWSAR